MSADESFSAFEIGELLAPGLLERATILAAEYTETAPFPHTSIDGFFSDGFCRRLIEEFPVSRQEDRFVEFGRPIPKVTVEDFSRLGEAYQQLDGLLRSNHFLAWLETVSGIEGLLFDPEYIGGGTHDNLAGGALHPHLDFNYHPTTGWYRRLNLIVYLNPGWQPEWGGNLVLCADPTGDDSTSNASYEPLVNRGVLFGTTERSWHGFDRLRLDQAPAGTSRRSISAYFYTERPPLDGAPEHSTLYAVPDASSARDTQERAVLEEEREAFVRYLRDERSRLSALTEHLRLQLSSLVRPQLQGYIEQVGACTGFYPDGFTSWTAPAMAIRLRAERPLRSLTAHGYVPAGPKRSLAMTVDGVVLATHVLGEEGVFTVVADHRSPAGSEIDLEIRCDEAHMPGDSRPLGFVLMRIVAEHDPL